jgi:hypothetical protein
MQLLKIVCIVITVFASNTSWCQESRFAPLYPDAYSFVVETRQVDTIVYVLRANGSVSSFNPRNGAFATLPQQKGEYVRRIEHVGGKLFLLTARGRLLESSAHLDAVRVVDTMVFSLFVDHDSTLVYAAGRTVKRFDRSGAMVIRSLSMASPTIDAIAARGDTILVLPTDEDAMLVFAGDHVDTIALDLTAMPRQFHVIEDGSLVYISRASKCYVQQRSLSDRFLDVTGRYGGELFYVASSMGLNDDGSRVLVLSGVRSLLGTFAVTLGPTRDRGRVVDSAIGSTASLSAVHYDGRSLLTFHRDGSTRYVTESDTMKVSGPLPSWVGEANWTVDINSDSIAVFGKRRSSSGQTVFGVSGVNESASVYLKDMPWELSTVGDVSTVRVRSDKSLLVAGNNGVFITDCNLASVRLVSTEFKGPLISDNMGNYLTDFTNGGFGMSEDQGDTWRSVVFEPRQQGIMRQAVSLPEWLLVNRSGAGFVAVPRPINSDTLKNAWTLKAPTSSTCWIAGADSVSARLIFMPWASTVSGDSMKVTLIRWNSPSDMVESSVTVLKPREQYGLVFHTSQDTLSILDSRSFRLLRIVGGRVESDIVLPRTVRSPFNETTEALVRFDSHDRLILVHPKWGIHCIVSLQSGLPTSMVDEVAQNISHVYLENVRPNPTTGTFTVDVGKFATADLATVTLQLCDLSGRVVRDYSRNLPKFAMPSDRKSVTLDVNDINEGAYFIVVRNSQTATALKVIIAR